MGTATSRSSPSAKRSTVGPSTPTPSSPHRPAPATLAVLGSALAQDRYNEALYRQAMRLRATDDDAYAIRQLRGDLTERLIDQRKRARPQAPSLSPQVRRRRGAPV